ncbi:hypothetical protein, partial [Ellagibacter isourolithinifaciens]|uniref:hypothetical protein n=1 Tax=Ellagibacter isourolithinifaciens TaxID=2137581 RepID=UPI003AADB766
SAAVAPNAIFGAAIVTAPTAAAVPINARLDSVFVCSLTEEPPWLSMLVFVWQKRIYNNT